MKHFIYRISGALPILLALTLSLASCNAKEESTEDETVITSESVAITSFSLSPDATVMPNLDSVFFSIDLEHGVVFNADSLPKGTRITKLRPVIKYPNTVTSAEIEMKGGTHREDGIVNYYKNPSDTIDFTGEVTLTLGADKDITKTYRLKVNVHQEEPDTFYWDNTATMKLPSRLSSPKNQKTVAFGSGAFSIIEENDGTFTAAFCSDLFKGVWDKTAFSPDFTPNLASLATDGTSTLYILSTDGNLLSSADGANWTRQDSGWCQIIGMFGNTLLGAKDTGTARYMTSYPAGSYDDIMLPEAFPRSGYSQPREYTSRWSSDSTIILFGGDNMASGTSASWAFDGSQWANIANAPLPALDGLSVIPYFAYLNNASNGLLKEFDALIALGGKRADGSVNNTVYISYDHGLSWYEAQKYMQLPQEITAGYMVDALAIATTMESNLSDRWKSKRRVNFEINGDLILWECPYIFMFGGFDNGSQLNDNIRSGVLKRLTFVPLF